MKSRTADPVNLITQSGADTLNLPRLPRSRITPLPKLRADRTGSAARTAVQTVYTDGMSAAPAGGSGWLGVLISQALPRVQPQPLQLFLGQGLDDLCGIHGRGSLEVLAALKLYTEEDLPSLVSNTGAPASASRIDSGSKRIK